MNYIKEFMDKQDLKVNEQFCISFLSVMKNNDDMDVYVNDYDLFWFDEKYTLMNSLYNTHTIGANTIYLNGLFSGEYKVNKLTSVIKEILKEYKITLQRNILEQKKKYDCREILKENLDLTILQMANIYGYNEVMDIVDFKIKRGIEKALNGAN